MCAAFAAAVAANLVSKLGEYLFAPIGRQFGYVLCYKSYVKDLEKEAEELKNARERVQASVDTARYDGKRIYTNVERWLENVNKRAEDAERLLTYGKNSKIACFSGCLPNPVVRHPIGRKMGSMTRVIQKLREKHNFRVVHYEDPPIGIVTAATPTARYLDNNEDVLESRALFAEEVIKAVTDDKVSVVGVYGQGGVGKSKLLADIERRAKKEKLFDVVVVATVSRNPDLKRIQGEIAYALRLQITNEEIVYGRADRLHGVLERYSEEKKVLIILDNLWTKLELNEVGIPCGHDNKAKGCKLLLTSRYREVLVEMSSDKKFRLKELEDGEARRLFERTQGHAVDDPDIRDKVDGVVKTCGGLPLLIVALAKRLKDEDVSQWEKALTNIEDMKSIVINNYNELKEERVRSLFLVCALDTGRSVVRDALVYCMGLGLYKRSTTLENIRYTLIVDLRSLQDSYLVESGDMGVFKMHDIILDVAISISSTDWFALVGRKECGFNKWSKEDLRKCTAISFNFVGTDEIPENLDCPNLRILLLCEHNSSLKISNSFFESMDKLQVLDITGLSFSSLPSSIEFLKNLNSLCLDYCHLEDVTVLGKLEGLQFLSLQGSTIVQLPKDIGRLTKLRFLDLKRCTELKVIEPYVLGSLVNLEELYMEESFDRWEAEDKAPRSNAALAELKNMKNLSTLSIAIPHYTNLPSYLPFGKLKNYNIQIGDVRNGLGEHKESRTLKLKLDSSNLLLEEWVQKCLQRTQNLHLDGLKDGDESIHDLCIEEFQELKHLHVHDSSSFRYVVQSIENVQCTAFARLESLYLENLNNLEKICHGCFTLQSFGKLKIVKVDNCSEVKHLFPLSMTIILSQLEEIEISRCHLMQQIVADVKNGDEIDVYPEVKSYNLHRLTLRNLPEMTNFCKIADHEAGFFGGQQIIKLQNLEAITIEGCQLIRVVFDLEGLTANGEVKILSQLIELTLCDLPSLGYIWNKNPRRTLCFQNLRTLRVQRCESLRFLFSSSMAKALRQIKEIEIASCELMEEIIDVQEEELQEAATNRTLEFPSLNSLSLEELPNLQTFSYGKYLICCPSLKRLKISRCPKMMTFSSSDQRQQPITTNAGGQQAFGHFNSDLPLPGFFNEFVLFPSLEELKLSCMSQLKRIWHNQFHGQSFCKLGSLTIEFCGNLSHVLPSDSIDRFQNLNKIEVVGCPSLEGLLGPVSLSFEDRQKSFVLSKLSKMKLLNLPTLKDLLKSDYKVTLTFPSLMEVNVRRCHSLPYLFSSATVKTLDKLAMLDVSCCDNLWGVIAMEGQITTTETFKFRNLSTLKLGDLGNLVSFCSTSSPSDGLHPLFDKKLAFPKLEKLHIEGIQQEELWNDVESFNRLKIIKVKQCPNLLNVIPSLTWKRLLGRMESLMVEECPCLRNLFTMSMAESLVELQYLVLGGCGEMEFIVASGEEKPEEAADKIQIPQLVTLYLHNMPKLKSFCQGKHFSEWPSLQEFTIENCKVVEVILGDASCRKLEGNVPTQQSLLLVQKIEFPSMESMKILQMDNVEKIWPDNLASNAFSKLKTLVVKNCEKLQSIFSSHTMLTRFQNLENITVTDCGSLEVIFHNQELNFSGVFSTSTLQVRELVLERLPKMKHVWSGLPQGGLTFGHLQSMQVVDCERLENLFSNSMAISMTRLEKLLVWNCGVEDIIVERDGVGDLFFPRLTDLTLAELPELRSFYRNSCASTWPLLKELRVRHCSKIRSFSLTSEHQSCQDTSTSISQPPLFSFEKVIQHLERLTLTKEDIRMLQLQQQRSVFVNLEELSLVCYHNEDDVFPSNFLLHRFPNLQVLTVICSSFEEIFPENAFGHGGATSHGGLTDAGRPLKSLGNLKRLKLYKLGNLRRVWKDGSLMVELLKQIEFLYFWRCHNFSIILPSLISFQRLTQLEVRDCAGLVHMGTCSAMTSLVHLTWLFLLYCGAMEDVVTDDGNGVEEISFPKLQQLTLDGLPRLQSFSPTNCAFRFPSLKHIIVKQCPKMSIFCEGALTTPHLDKVLLSTQDGEGHWEGDLNATIRTLST